VEQKLVVNTEIKTNNNLGNHQRPSIPQSISINEGSYERAQEAATETCATCGSIKDIHNISNHCCPLYMPGGFERSVRQHRIK
jgi:hypothetical protein